MKISLAWRIVRPSLTRSFDEERHKYSWECFDTTVRSI